MLMITKIMFLSLPTAYSIPSIMLQVIFQRYMLLLVVVVFFYLLILKLTHLAFFPGLVFPPETGWVHFVLDSPFSLGYCQTSQRGQAGGLGANSVSSIRKSSKEARATGYAGGSPHSYLLFLIFWQSYSTTCPT